MTVFEDKLRSRAMRLLYVADENPDEEVVPVSSEERDALADAVEALRDLLYDENVASLDRGQAALARLDAA